MPRKKEDLSITTNETNATLIPPNDLWERLEEELDKLKMYRSRPHNSFTMKEFRARMILGKSAAQVRIAELIKNGILTMQRLGKERYYILREKTEC